MAKNLRIEGTDGKAERDFAPNRIAFTRAARFSSPRVHLRNIDRKTRSRQSG